MRLTKRLRLLLGCLSLGGAAIQAAPTPAAAQTVPKVLRVVPSADLTMLDPDFSSIVITRIYAMMVYDELFAWNSKLESKPEMVKDWSTSADGLTWRFTLRPGLKFHDGQSVTTADVIPSLQRWMKRDVVGQKLGADLAGMNAVDPATLEIKLAKPYPSMLFSLGSAIGEPPFIMRAKDLQGDATKPITTAIGSGPFTFDRDARVSGALTVFEKNKDYAPRDEPPDGLAGGRKVNFDRVEWHVIPDAATASAALQSGEVDLIEQPALDLLPVLRKTDGVQVVRQTDLSNQTMLRPNALYPPFNDPRARLALAYIINQRDIMAAGFGDPINWKECRAYFICGGANGTTAGTAELKPDLAHAKELLKEAGYNGEKLVFPATNEIAWIGQMDQVIAEEMKQAGMNVDLVWGDWGTVSARLSNKGKPEQGGWNLFATGASGPTMQSPLTNLGTNMACNGMNFAGWPCDEKAEGLRQAYLDADAAHRPAALDALHSYLAQVQPYIVLGQYDQPVALRSNISGFLQSPVIVYWNLDRR